MADGKELTELPEQQQVEITNDDLLLIHDAETNQARGVTFSDISSVLGGGPGSTGVITLNGLQGNIAVQGAGGIDITDNGTSTITIDGSNITPTIPTNLSEFNNDVPFLTSAIRSIGGFSNADIGVRGGSGTGFGNASTYRINVDSNAFTGSPELQVDGPESLSEFTNDLNFVQFINGGNGINVTGAIGTANIALNADLDALNDVEITSPSANTYLRYNGSEWIDAPVVWNHINNKPDLFDGQFASLTDTGLDSASEGQVLTVQSNGSVAFEDNVSSGGNGQDLSDLTLSAPGNYIDVVDTDSNDYEFSFNIPDEITFGNAWKAVTTTAPGQIMTGQYVHTGGLTSFTGGSLSSSVDLSMNTGATVTGLPDPTDATDAASKNYVDTLFDGAGSGGGAQFFSDLEDVDVSTANSGQSWLKYDSGLGIWRPSSGSPQGLFTLTEVNDIYLQGFDPFNPQQPAIQAESGDVLVFDDGDGLVNPAWQGTQGGWTVLPLASRINAEIAAGNVSIAGGGGGASPYVFVRPDSTATSTSLYASGSDVDLTFDTPVTNTGFTVNNNTITVNAQGNYKIEVVLAYGNPGANLFGAGISGDILINGSLLDLGVADGNSAPCTYAGGTHLGSASLTYAPGQVTFTHVGTFSNGDVLTFRVNGFSTSGSDAQFFVRPSSSVMVTKL